MGDRSEKMRVAMMMLNVQQQIVGMQGGGNGPLVTLQNTYNTLDKLVDAAGYKSIEPYFSDPRKSPPPAPQPSPQEKQETAITQRELATTQMNNDTKVQVALINANSKLFDQPSENPLAK
jgi:hypothetical protein